MSPALENLVRATYTKFGYQAAKVQRESGRPAPQGGSGSFHQNTDLDLLRRMAEEFDRDNAIYDGVLNRASGEECEAGGVQTRTCEAGCRVPRCGDGVRNLRAGERCDDGNVISGDGCDDLCQNEGPFPAVAAWSFSSAERSGGSPPPAWTFGQ